MGFFSSIMERRTTPENPSFDLNSEAAWEAFDAGPRSAAGVNVNRKSALTYSPWWRGCSLIAGDVGKIRLYTYRRQGEGKDRAKDHPAYRLLRYKPNEYQTANIFREQLTGHALSGGNGYAYIEREGMKPISLLPLDPETITPVRENGVLLYVWNDKGTYIKIEAHNIFHLKGPGYDGLCGYNVVQFAKDSLGLGIAAERYSGKVLVNGARPGVVLQVPGRLPPDQRDYLRKTWEQMHNGIDNAHRTAILENGMEAKTLAFSSEDVQLIQNREHQIREVANWLGIPPHKLGDTTRTAYASLEQENQSYLDDALARWLIAWEMECWDKLLTEEEKDSDNIIVEFRRDDVVRADTASRALYLRTALGGHPWYTVNEARNNENMNPVEDGDTVPTPLNMGNSGGDQNQPNDPAASNVKPKGPNSGNGDPNKKRQDDAIALILAHAQKRVVKRIAAQAEKAAKQPKFLDWLERMTSEHQGIVREMLVPAYDAWLVAHSIDDDPQKRSDDFLKAIHDELFELSGKVTVKKLPESITAWEKEKV